MPSDKEIMPSVEDHKDFMYFNKIYNEFRPGFIRFAASYLDDREMAEDFVAESFMAYWDNRHRLTPESNVRAYILTILKNKCLAYIKREDFRNRLIKQMGDDFRWELDMRISTLEVCDPNEVFSEEITEIVQKAMKSLPRKTMEVFMLSRDQHKSNREIAEIMGITVKGVEFHMTKALALLREELKDYLPALIFILLM